MNELSSVNDSTSTESVFLESALARMGTVRVHPTALVHPDAKIDSSCRIGPFCQIGPDVILGPRNALLSHVIIEGNTTIGKGNVFHPFSVIGGVPQDLKYRGEKALLEIGDYNTFRESVTCNIGTSGGGGVTRVGNQNLLMAYVHLGHDVRVGHHAILANSCQIAGHVHIEDWAILGGSTAVSQYIRIGANSYIGGLSGIDRDVPPFVTGRGLNQHFEILGLNLVGLKRRGFSAEKIAQLMELNRLYFKDKTLEKEAALKRLEDKLGSVDVVEQFVRFVRASDKGSYR